MAALGDVLTAGIAYHRKMLEMIDELTPPDDDA